MKKIIISFFIVSLFFLYACNDNKKENYKIDNNYFELILNESYDAYSAIEFHTIKKNIEFTYETYVNDQLVDKEIICDYDSNDLNLIAATSFVDLENMVEYITIIFHVDQTILSKRYKINIPPDIYPSYQTTITKIDNEIILDNQIVLSSEYNQISLEDNININKMHLIRMKMTDK